MPLFRFNVRGGQHFNDRDGTDLADLAHARAHAGRTACELMRHCERRVRDWRLEVRDEAGALVHELLFAALDPTLDHLQPPHRANVEQLSRSVAATKDAIRSCQMTVRQSRAILARITRKPYLAAVEGVDVLGDQPRRR
jgi:hypothetical protein